MQILTKNQFHGKIIGNLSPPLFTKSNKFRKLIFFWVWCFLFGGGGVWMRSQVWKQVSYTDEKELPLEFFFFIFFIYKKELRLELVVEMVTNKSLRATIDGGRILNRSDSWEKAYGYEIDEAWLCAPNSIA